MAERWRDIPGHKGYQASSLGRVRSVPRTLKDGREAGGVVLAPQEDRDGYLSVKLSRGRRVKVHVAVALAFHGRPEVRHMNDDRDDNRPENLAWGSHGENERDKKRAAGKENRIPGGPFRTETFRTNRLPGARWLDRRDPEFPGPG